MGIIIDISADWDAYPAAKLALNNNVLDIENMNTLYDNNVINLYNCYDNIIKLRNTKELYYSQEYILEHTQHILSIIRKSNHVIRWRLLHKCTTNSKAKYIIKQQESSSISIYEQDQQQLMDTNNNNNNNKPPPKLNIIIKMILYLSHLELTFKDMLE